MMALKWTHFFKLLSVLILSLNLAGCGKNSNSANSGLGADINGGGSGGSSVSPGVVGGGLNQDQVRQAIANMNLDADSNGDGYFFQTFGDNQNYGGGNINFSLVLFGQNIQFNPSTTAPNVNLEVLNRVPQSNPAGVNYMRETYRWNGYNWQATGTSGPSYSMVKTTDALINKVFMSTGVNTRLVNFSQINVPLSQNGTSAGYQFVYQTQSAYQLRTYIYVVAPSLPLLANPVYEEVVVQDIYGRVSRTVRQLMQIDDR